MNLHLCRSLYRGKLSLSLSLSVKMDKKEAEDEALKLKTLAEEKYKESNLKSALKYAKRAQRLFEDLDGVSEMVTAFSILRVAAKSSGTGGSPDWYKILQTEPFSHINIIKKQYKKLALTLHPDKNTFVASEEAFKLVGDAFRCLSDKIRRKEFDVKLRIAIQAAATTAAASDGTGETFWTACSKCRLLHQFERRYIGHNLMCPRCKKCFLAMEVEANESDGEAFRVSGRGKSKGGVSLRRRVEPKQRMSSVGEILQRSTSKSVERLRTVNKSGELSGRLRSNRARIGEEMTLAEMQMEAKEKVMTLAEMQLEAKEKKMTLAEMQLEAKEKKMTLAEMQLEAKQKKMTLAEMQLEAKQKVLQRKNEDQEKEERREKAKEEERRPVPMNTRSSRMETRTSSKNTNNNLVIEMREASKKGRNLETETPRAPKRSGNSRTETRTLKKSRNLGIQRCEGAWKGGNFEIMAVEDSDFYDFDRDRVERSFKKGQVWAIYDDDDGMPRHYGLIDEVVSVNPFELKMSWLDLQSNGDEGLLCWEKLGFHISCGRFKVSKNTVINSVNFFSHVVDCDRAAKEVYRIYPKKGSIWALYNDDAFNAEGRCSLSSGKRCYDIVVFLTSYSEMHGLSMAYLEKVDGFKTVFKRREIGSHAIRWFEKDDVKMFSHQIPARKLSGVEALEPLKDCWELDPASLSSALLTIAWEK